MALGDKLPVVMGKEKAVPNGVATLGTDGKLAEAQRPTPTEAGAADLTLSNLSNYQKALRNIGGRPNRNLMDNAYFKGGGSQQGGGQFPINQRGQTSYATASGYTIDRWMHGTEPGDIELTADGVKFNGTEGMNLTLSQILDLSVSQDTVVTLSALYRGQIILDYWGTTLSPSPVVESGWGLHAVTYTIPAGTNLANRFYSPTIKTNGAQISYIAAVKLELGDTQTLAYQDEDGAWQLFETPDYGEELAKCRYYFRRYGVSSLGQIYLPPALGVSGTEANFSIVSEPMRIAPTISGNGFLLAGTTGDGFVADGSASFSLLGASPLSGIITVKVTCSNRTLIPGNYYTLYANPEYGAFLDLSAEL